MKYLCNHRVTVSSFAAASSSLPMDGEEMVDSEEVSVMDIMDGEESVISSTPGSKKNW